MASQTGTLKFRQSDGTYTELYPKTTIAQVDGLQTQLDSINTSLQNKVEYNALPLTNKATIYVNNNDQNVYGGVATEINQSIGFFAGIRSPSTYTSLLVSAIGDLDKSIEIYRYTENAESISKTIATRDYVVSQIQGAINSSY